MMGPANPTTELMELRQSEAVRTFYDDGVGVGNIDPGFDDGRAHEYVVLLMIEILHDAFQRLFS